MNETKSMKTANECLNDLLIRTKLALELVLNLCLQLRWPSGKSVRAGSCRLGFDSKSGQTNDFKIDIQSFPA